MKNTLRAIPLVAALMLGGCAGGTVSVTDVQNAAVQVCGFLPTAQTVAGILANGNAIIGTASAVASAICAAVGPQKAAMKAGKKGFAPVYVNGVQVHGRFIDQ